MITLNEWFLKYQFRPFKLIICLFVVVWLILAAVNFRIISARQREATIGTGNLLSSTIKNRDLMMTESLMATMSREIGAQSAILCKENIQLHALDSDLSDCTEDTSLFTNTIKTLIPGTDAIFLKVRYNMLQSMSWIFVVLATGLVLFILGFILLWKIKRSLDSEVLNPLFDNLLTSKNFKIVELNSLSKRIQEAQAALIVQERYKAELDLASQVAHDIRSPLSALNLVVPSIQTASEDQKIVIASALSRINSIAESLLRKNRSESSATKEFKEELLGLIHEKTLILGKNPRVNISHEISENLALPRDLVPKEILRVISNLINNSIEALSENGKISITAKKNLKNVEISVSDTGCGIPSNCLESIFTKGYSVGKKKKILGNGLGLFHAKRTIESSGGSIFVSSKVGVGTTFILQFPLQG